MPTVVRSTKPFHSRHALNTIRIYADGPGTGYFDISSLFRLGQVNMGIQCQSSGASVTASFTMEDADIVEKNPASASIPWQAQTALAAGNIAVYPIMATWIRVVFAGAGTFHVGAA